MTVGHTWQAFSRDAGYQLSGGLPIVGARGVLRHLGVDACELTTPYTPDAYGRLAPGCGIAANRDDGQQFSGLVAGERTIGWDADSGDATIVVRCIGDDVHLADRLVLPSPLADPSAQTADYWQVTAKASTAMWLLIRDQAGPFAAPSRRVPTLRMGTDPDTGATRLWSAQFAPTLDTLHGWGVLSGADLGVRVRTDPDGLVADVYAPRDVSAGVRFSASLTNLTGWGLTQTPPEVTVAVAAGQGDLRNRVRRVSSSASAADLAWGRRIERYVDQRDEADVVKLAQSAADALAQGIGTTSLTIAAQDTATARYGDGWGLGDRVTVHVGLPGGVTAATVTDLVREVAFEVDGAGREKITPAVGTSDAKAVRPGPTQAAVARVAGGLARLNRNK